MNPVAVAARGKGARGAARRAAVIGRRYGVTPRRMDGAIRRFTEMLREYDAKATFPVTAAALGRARGVVERYSPESEIAIHGYYHVDYTGLSASAQAVHLRRAQRLWVRRGIPVTGFRAPYLRSNTHTLAAVREAGLTYDASRAIAFPVAPLRETAAYARALEFEMAESASEVASLPRWEDGVLRLPYTLPDDEAIVDRLGLDPAEARGVWVRALDYAYDRGEMVGLGLHPERFDRCEPPLRAALAAARSKQPSVWIARLDEIAAWWTARAAASVVVTRSDDDTYRVTADGHDGLRILTRGVDVQGDAVPWFGDDRLLAGQSGSVRAANAPVVHVSNRSAPELIAFLREHGYPIERVADEVSQGVFLDQPVFGLADEKRVLDVLAASPGPLVRLARWPNAARAALSVTGDIDALTIWDYGLRVLGR